MSQHQQAVGHLVRLKTHRLQSDAQRKKLIARAKAQLDTMGPAIQKAQEALSKDVGGIFTHRRLRALLAERARLEAIIGRD